MARSTGRKISTELTLSGEQEFKHALSEAAREVRVMDADLKAVAAEFKATGDAQTYITQKTELLKSKMAEQQRIIDMLNDRLRENKESNKLSAAQVDDYKIRLSNATARMFNMRRELENIDREAEEFGRDSVKVGRQIERGIGDGAEEAEKSVKSLIEQMQEDISTIKGSVAFTVAGQVANTISGAVNGITDFVTSNRDYRKQLSYLKRAAEAAGYDWDKIIQLNNEIGAFTGDMDGAAEATSNLMQTGLNMDWIGTAIGMFEGASILWQDTLKIENLAESFQETIATGKATGAFGELVERLGGSLEALKAVLGEAETDEEKAQAALTYISDKGLLKTAEIYKQKNAEMLEAQKAEIELAQAWAELSAELEPIVTEITRAMNYVVEQITDVVKRIKEGGLLSGLFGAGKTGNSDLYDENGNLNPEVAETWGYSKEQTDAWNAKNSQSNRENAKKEASAAANAYADAAIKELDGRGPEINDIIQAAFGPGNEKENRAAAAALIQAMEPTEEEKAELFNTLTSMGIDAASIFDQAFGAGMDTSAQSAQNLGANIGAGVKGGLDASMPAAVNAAWNYANQINAALASVGAGLGNIIVSGGGNYYNGGSTGGQSVIKLQSNLYMNKKLIGTASDQYIGRKASRLG